LAVRVWCRAFGVIDKGMSVAWEMIDNLGEAEPLRRGSLVVVVVVVEDPMARCCKDAMGTSGPVYMAPSLSTE
jgi:hypothetical protein